MMAIAKPHRSRLDRECINWNITDSFNSLRILVKSSVSIETSLTFVTCPGINPHDRILPHSSGDVNSIGHG